MSVVLVDAGILGLGGVGRLACGVAEGDRQLARWRDDAEQDVRHRVTIVLARKPCLDEVRARLSATA